MVVANCNASCYWLQVHCSQWQLLLFFSSGSRLHLSQYRRFHAVSLTRCTNPELVAKCEQMLCRTSCELNERAAKPKFVAHSWPSLCYSQPTTNELIAQGEELETEHQLPGRCFSYFAAFRTAQHDINFFFVVSHQKMAAKETSGLCVSKKLKVHILIKNHPNSLLFGYYKLGFRCLELNSYTRIASIWKT